MHTGRRSPKNAPALQFSSFRCRGALIPPLAISEDVLAELHDWEMLGNDEFGVCVAVTWANERHAVSTLLGSAPSYPSLEEVFALYRTQNPSFVPDPQDPVQDEGMDIQTCLESLVAHGGPDGVKPVCFARLNEKDPEELEQALFTFGAIWLGVDLTNTNMAEFDSGWPWDHTPKSKPIGGHSIMAGGYDSRSPSDEVRVITWGKETGATDAFLRTQIEEAWVVIWPEHLGTKQFQASVDFSSLAAEYAALTGHRIPAVPPAPPAPSPAPPAPPAPIDARAMAALRECLATGDVAAWIEARHTGKNREAATAFKKLFEAVGLLKK